MAAMIVDFQNCSIFILLCFFPFLCYSVFFFFKKTNDLGPSPPSLPIIGHLHHFLSVLPHKAFQKISTKYGPLLHLHICSFPIVLVSSPTMAHEIFTTHDLNISSRNTPAIDESLLFGPSGFTVAPYGDYVKFIKKLLATKLLRPRAIEKSRGVRAEELKQFYLKLHDKALKKESIEIGKETMKFTNNMICRMSIGRSFSEENGEVETLRELIIKSFALSKQILFVNVLRRPLEMLGLMSLFKKDIMDVSRGFDELLERVLAEHEEKREEDQDMDMMDLLLEACRDENAEYKITRNQIKSLFVEIFLGGTDTSAHTTQWTMAELVNNPYILGRLRDEIDLVVGKERLIQETDLPNLPYLQAVVKEGLRLHPPAPLLVRMFDTKCVIKDFFKVPEKTTLVVNVYGVMRDPDSWEDPNEFKPERFLTSKQEEEKVLKYLPFAAGRRGCPATNVGYIFVGISIGMMVQCFDWSIKDKVSMKEVYAGMSLSMAHPPKCTPVSRLSL
ncbi:hypothetical protein Bca4012_096209 [Brassica carinata]|uniref:Cytochrome P450 n=4 Tax=Brassica TaxID=3705 RepID=A0A0D3DVY1_BRAOL|nr:PREDICTED: cytochrome P450 705A20-like [Brassica oleracea var. oleracea]KAF3570837.1 hypothetical protein F2Q69_00062802 [Brassica cretica]CAF2114185.1 unnamed protein product [Brassica napus]VDD58372.1 unnamed protein product [Brassica oleracea]